VRFDEGTEVERPPLTLRLGLEKEVKKEHVVHGYFYLGTRENGRSC